MTPQLGNSLISGASDHIRKMALMWYISDVTMNFNKFDNDIIKALAQELSETSLRIPIWFKPEDYKNGTFKKIFKDINSKYLDAQPNNECSVTINGEVVKEKVTPLYLMGLFAYCVDKLSGGQIEDMPGFDYLKMGKLLSKEE